MLSITYQTFRKKGRKEYAGLRQHERFLNIESFETVRSDLLVPSPVASGGRSRALEALHPCTRPSLEEGKGRP